MASGIIYDIKDIAEKLYGYKPYTLSALPAEQIEANPYQVKPLVKRESTRKGSPIYGGQDLIGREVFLPVTIEGGGKNYDFPYSVLAMRRKKFMVSTPMVERGGSVKELIGLDDWQISMKGFLIDPLNQFPDDQLYELNELFKRKEPVRLKCALSDIFLEENDFVVITDFDLPDKSKIIGVRDFVFAMESDSILTLEVD